LFGRGYRSQRNEKEIDWHDSQFIKLWGEVNRENALSYEAELRSKSRFKEKKNKVLKKI